MRKIEIKQTGTCCTLPSNKQDPNLQPPCKNNLPVAIIGAGPVGLAAAAHLAERGENFVLIESGTHVGQNVASWGHVRLFSPWQYNVDQAARRLLSKHGWNPPSPDTLPTGQELLEQYLQPLADLPEIKSRLVLNTKVVAIGRKDTDKMKSAMRDGQPFVIYAETNGAPQRFEARAVIDASGTWGHANSVNASGIWTKEEQALHEHIYYGIPDIQGKDRVRYTGKRTAVVGGGHSALNTLLDLANEQEANPETNITWIMRKHRVEEAYGGEENDQLEARGELGSRIHQLVNSKRIQVVTPFKIHQLSRLDGKIEIIGEHNDKHGVLKGFDEIIVNTGSRPDFSFLRELRLSVDQATESVQTLAPLIDPNVHSCGTVRPYGEKELRHAEKDFYIVGMKSYGRAPTFLMATGYEQARSVVAHLTGDIESAMKVELHLPETGVCRVHLSSVVPSSQSSCCG